MQSTSKRSVTLGESQYTFRGISGFGQVRKRKHLELIFANIVPKLDESATVLEIGPGRGEFAAMVRSKGLTYIGVEPSELLGAELRSKGFSILQATASAIPMDDASVDLIYSYDVLEHLNNYSVVLQFFNEAYRVLRPGGSIVTIAPNAETLGILFWLYEYQHSYLTTSDRVCSMLKDANLGVTSSVAFFAELGMTNNRLARTVDRLMAHAILLFARNTLVISFMRTCLGRDLTLQIHKNVYDHFAVVARRG